MEGRDALREEGLGWVRASVTTPIAALWACHRGRFLVVKIERRVAETAWMEGRVKKSGNESPHSKGGRRALLPQVVSGWGRSEASAGRA